MSDEPAAGAEPKKKGKPIVLILVLANVLIGGGAAAFFLLGKGDGGSATAAHGGGHGGDDSHGGGGDDSHGGGGDDIHGGGHDDGHGGGGHGGGDAHGGGGHAAAGGGASGSGGPIVEFKPIIVNLNEPEGTRYLKATVAVQLVNGKVQNDVEKLMPVIRDYFLRDLSELNFRQTMGSKNKLAIKRRLLKRFNEAVGTEAGVDVHLTEFVVQ